MSDLVAGAALVTGGGSGLGRAAALELAARGAPVGVVDLQAERAEETAAEIRRRGGRAQVARADVSSWEDVDRAVGDVVGALGTVGILVNGAGILDGYGNVDAMDPAVWQRVIAINLTGTFLLCHRVLPEMLAAGRGCIVNIASTAGLVGDGGGAAYIASKHGVVGLTRHIGVKYADRGITANAICPGPIGTDLRAHSMEILGPGAPEMSNLGFGANMDLLRAAVPVGRRGTPEEIAAAACFLASESAAYITGQTIVVDGGWTAR
jgi:NAD(P)-dependent dehydrogenase (short-subunit alcohol dehydrogenase family)